MKCFPSDLHVEHSGEQLSGDFTVNPGAMDAIAGALEGIAADIEAAPRPDVAGIVNRAMPNSPLVAASSDATEKLTNAQTAVSGQWETLASAVRAARSIAVDADDENATKISTLSVLPAGELPR